MVYEIASGQALSNCWVPDVGVPVFGPSVLKQPSPGPGVRVFGGWQKLFRLLIVQLGDPHVVPETVTWDVGAIFKGRLYAFCKH